MESNDHSIQWIDRISLALLIIILPLSLLYLYLASKTVKKTQGHTLLLSQPSAGKTHLALLLSTSIKMKNRLPTITTIEDTFYEPRYWDTKAHSTLEKFRLAHPKELLQNIVIIIHPTSKDSIRYATEILYDVILQNKAKLPILMVANGMKGTRRKIEAEL
jgi:hypothetical protein